MKSLMNRVWSSVIALLLASYMVLMVGCAHYRLSVPDSRAETPYPQVQETRHAFLWGLIPPDTRWSHECTTNAIDNVRITYHAGHVVATVLTLGIWMPIEVGWTCQRPKPGIIIDE